MIVAIIPVAGELVNGTKRNLLSVAGKPLLQYTVEYAKSCPEISRTIVATADAELAAAAKQFGADVVILPSALAQRGTPIKEVLLHALDLLQPSPELVVFLEATHPFRKPEWVSSMIRILRENNLDQVFLAKSEKDNFWTHDADGELVFFGKEQSTREQKQPIYRELAGLGTVMKPEVIRNPERVGKNVGIVPVAGWQTLIDIKSAEDAAIAEQLSKLFSG